MIAQTTALNLICVPCPFSSSQAPWLPMWLSHGRARAAQQMLWVLAAELNQELLGGWVILPSVNHIGERNCAKMNSNSKCFRFVDNILKVADVKIAAKNCAHYWAQNEGSYRTNITLHPLMGPKLLVQHLSHFSSRGGDLEEHTTCMALGVGASNFCTNPLRWNGTLLFVHLKGLQILQPPNEIFSPKNFRVMSWEGWNTSISKQ